MATFENKGDGMDDNEDDISTSSDSDSDSDSHAISTKSTVHNTHEDHEQHQQHQQHQHGGEHDHLQDVIDESNGRTAGVTDSHIESTTRNTSRQRSVLDIAFDHDDDDTLDEKEGSSSSSSNKQEEELLASPADSSSLVDPKKTNIHLLEEQGDSKQQQQQATSRTSNVLAMTTTTTTPMTSTKKRQSPSNSSTSKNSISSKNTPSPKRRKLSIKSKFKLPMARRTTKTPPPKSSISSSSSQNKEEEPSSSSASLSIAVPMVELEESVLAPAATIILEATICNSDDDENGSDSDEHVHVVADIPDVKDKDDEEEDEDEQENKEEYASALTATVTSSATFSSPNNTSNNMEQELNLDRRTITSNRTGGGAEEGITTTSTSISNTNRSPKSSGKSPKLSTKNKPSSSSNSSSSNTMVKLSSLQGTPTQSSPVVVSEKRILLHAGPADSLPVGWTVKHYKRTTGLKHTDRYWFSPLLKKKFRSLAQVGRFLDFLSKEQGDEARAWELFRTSPPGPDEIRSGRGRGGVSPHHVAKGRGGATTGAAGSKAAGGGSGGGGGTGSLKKRGIASHGFIGGSTSDYRHIITGGIMRPLRLMPLSSPGLFMTPSPSLLQQHKEALNISAKTQHDSESKPPDLVLNVQGYVTPSAVFENSIYNAGYTKNILTEAKHFGSSVRKSVCDMFDTSSLLVKTPLIPDEIWTKSVSTSSRDSLSSNVDRIEDIKDSEDVENNTPGVLHKMELFQVVMKELEVMLQDGKQIGITHGIEWKDMIPTSITNPLPKSYLEKHHEYCMAVKHREGCLKRYHEQKERNQSLMDTYEDEKDRYEIKEKNVDVLSGEPPEEPKMLPLITIPPIPLPPELSLPDEFKDIASNGMNESPQVNDEKAPSGKTLSLSCLPENKKYLTAHLDPDFFLLPSGRYYGLRSNEISDPQFVGPNAPGIGGVSNSNHTGLATSFTGHIAIAEQLSSTMLKGSTTEGIRAAISGKEISKSGTGTTGDKISSPINSKKSSSKKSTPSKAKKKKVGASLTGFNLQLKKIMEVTGPEASAMRECIIRAAVFASRTSAHSGSFVGSNGETYPDVSKAFSNYANLRPCARCKSNKQGAYHCRLRRKHKNPDFDGGESSNILEPFFEMPVENLILVRSKKAI